MNNRIRQAVIWAVSEAFGLPVYIDVIEQDLEEPCFLITSLNKTENHVVMDRYQRQYPYMIQYFPQSGGCSSECNDVSDRLFDVLEYVKYEDALYRADSMNGETQNGILNFSVTYKSMVIKSRKSEEQKDGLMEKLEQNAEIKED